MCTRRNREKSRVCGTLAVLCDVVKNTTVLSWQKFTHRMNIFDIKYVIYSTSCRVTKGNGQPVWRQISAAQAEMPGRHIFHLRPVRARVTDSNFTRLRRVHPLCRYTDSKLSCRCIYPDPLPLPCAAYVYYHKLTGQRANASYNVRERKHSDLSGGDI